MAVVTDFVVAVVVMVGILGKFSFPDQDQLHGDLFTLGHVLRANLAAVVKTSHISGLRHLSTIN